ncbi:AAA family ATPase [Planomicrobium sp. CPCC 101079]|uniref:AAA family ATPase n=1 Tax=Planomicrobium sp. CPCC 101079 TaxID=2599618 RepID=UPI0011B6B117|nr:AAA family ATPase [Planomicrobium sp. CPCC 101079]TWT02357.1 SMC family ATPase [Planomicrobium sp. CPCC 101079]
MRPLKLKLTAFGPYKQTEVIDFADLQGNQLFVISGSTGSGKTTIFDGICFALYGSASGSDRSESRILRSDFADDGTHTCVEMEFEIHNKVYRILRQMGHVKKGNKGATGERYEFFEKCEDGEKPCVERQIVSEINRRVEEIIGLSQNQFSQIVMLPQGEFRKLLTSETDNKEEILRKIFKTEPYKMISERLKQKKDAAAKAFQLEEQVLASHIRSIASSLPERDSAIFELLSRDHYNVHQVMAALGQEAEFYEEKIVSDETVYQSAYKRHAEKQQIFHEAKQWNDRFDELAQKRERLERMTAELPAFEEKERRLQHAERASLIEGLENFFRELQASEAEKMGLLKAAQENAQTALDQWSAAEAEFVVQEKRQSEREQLHKKVIELQSKLPAVEELDGKRAELKRLEALAKQAAAEAKSAEETWQTEKQVREKIALQAAELEQKVEAFDAKNANLAEVKDKCRIAAAFLTAKSSWTKQEKESRALEAAHLQAAAHYAELEASWFADQAKVLAEQLHEGEACPVCGSLEHPNKIKHTHESMVSKEQLDLEKSKLDKVDSRFRDASARLNALAEQLDDKKSEALSFGLKPELVEEAYPGLETERKELDAEVGELQKDKQKLRALKETLGQSTQQVEQFERLREDAAAAMQKQRAVFETATAVFEQQLLSIPEEIRVLAVLEKHIQQALAEKDRLEKLWAQAQERFQAAKETKASTVVALEHAENTAEEVKNKKEQAGQQFFAALQKSAFEAESAYHQAKLTESEQMALKKEIEVYKQNRHTLVEQVKELEILLVGREKTNSADLEAELAELKRIYEQAFAQLNHSREFEKTAVALIGKIAQATELAAQAEQEMSRVADLHDMIRGQNPQKISFERYLQIEYLEQIIHSANERLRELSNGQFYLIRSDRQEARGKQSGLGLDVYDSYTGQTRDVKTLSGGEKFNASLCLALGMADVIQSFQGSVSIDTMFIDEGFGSLDEESLNKSIETLIDLQKSGRMIGVISHVQELKSAIPAILEVKKSKEGYSQTRFLLK